MNHRVIDDATGRSIDAWVHRAGRDLVIAVGGGTHPHVGSVVVSQPVAIGDGGFRSSPSSSVLTIPPHKEEAIARPIAEAVCRATGCVTVVTAGVHEDDLDLAGITTYLELAERLATEIAEAVTVLHGDSIP